MGLLTGCGGQRQTGSANDPNEQQGYPRARPEKGITGAQNAQPGDNKANRNAHTGLKNGQQDNK